jgi:amino acid permease
MSETAPQRRRTPPTLVAIIMIALLLALSAIYWGLFEFFAGNTESASIYMSIGMAMLALSAYMLYQTRKRMIRLTSMEMQPLSSTVQCQKCGFKNVREFQKGDFVFKETTEMCPKDNLKMMIAAIYREVKDKEKAKELGY